MKKSTGKSSVGLPLCFLLRNKKQEKSLRYAST